MRYEIPCEIPNCPRVATHALRFVDETTGALAFYRHVCDPCFWLAWRVITTDPELLAKVRTLNAGWPDHQTDHLSDGNRRDDERQREMTRDGKS